MSQYSRLICTGLIVVVTLGCGLSRSSDLKLAGQPTEREETESLPEKLLETMTGEPKPASLGSSETQIASEKLLENWPGSTPEEQGMDSNTLAAMLEMLESDERNIHSILIARHGVLVLEAYLSPFNRETPHNIYSCTKSITSAVMGAALQDDLIKSIDKPVYTLFPDLTLDDERKKEILIRHLLTMSSGLEWIEPLRSGLNDNWYMHDSEFPAQYFFDRALVAEPGTQFNYNSGGSHLLSVIIQLATGEKTADYAARRLFAPLGISRYQWAEDPNDTTIGGTGLALTSSDMLRIGQLYLQRGSWKNETVLSPQWVAESTRGQIAALDGGTYGYQWWVHPDGIYNALGWGGQQIIIIPQQDMTVVFTAGDRSAFWNSYADLLEGFIIPAAKSSSPLPLSPAGNEALKDSIYVLANPEPREPAPLPKLITKINNKVFVDLNGTHGWSTFSFNFDRPEEASMELIYGEKSEEMSLRIGLDGVYRVTDSTNYGPVAMKGTWKDGNTFILTQQFLKEAERITMSMTFYGEGIKRFSQWTVEDYSEESEAVFLYR